MVRGGHLDVAILGAYEVAENGDLANWRTGPKGVPAVGGAMDLVHGAKRVAVITDHVTKDGKPKLVEALHPAADRRRLRHPRLYQPRRDRHRGRPFRAARKAAVDERRRTAGDDRRRAASFAGRVGDLVVPEL